MEKIQKAKKNLEEREQALNPDKPIDDKKQLSFANPHARMRQVLTPMWPLIVRKIIERTAGKLRQEVYQSRFYL
ncbi:hypothetical protein [Endozoicomonas sp. GU-1]|uniref:hypothetical protein n=1 Tax=Endozoicomonas sp. GU-1 TaxID=3009078 RepID=UPI0022B48D41|nr:hypothetical protein [Endozoicomonas sp. GU-1]WBA80159.1 hypothetical protein O2T12_17675 [Endozoicomonas sp. GU-1]